MVPYVDERDTDGLIGLGLEWHPKLLFRTEISGTVLNTYHTPLMWVKNATEIGYWLGGQVTGGIAPQLSEFSGEVSRWDGEVARWLTAYAAWGHIVEGGVTTLRYDTDCCHVEGSCEWEVCADTILSRLTGGSASAGLYVGHAAHVTVPPDATPENGTVLVFVAWTVPRGNLTVGDPARARLTVVATSTAPGRVVDLVGGFLAVTERGERIEVTAVDASGAAVDRTVVAGPVGPVRYNWTPAPMSGLRLVRLPPTTAGPE